MRVDRLGKPEAWDIRRNPAKQAETMKQALVLDAPISAKEDRDYLLEYKSINLSALDRHDVLGVPVDNLSRDEAVAVVLDLIEKKKGPHHVMFVDPLKLMRI